MHLIKALIAAALLVTIPYASLNASDMKNVIAWPVPFNPKKGVLKIGNTDPGWSDYTLNAEIYDINGDSVCSISGLSPSIIWNGRNGHGRHVKPGLYLIKITAEKPSGEYGKKIIRILVDY